MKNLLILRQTAGLSQQALAKKFNLSQQTIYKYENGIAEPNLDTLKQLSKFFNVSIDYLVEDDDSIVIQPYSQSSNFTSDEIELIRKYRLLHPSVRHAVCSFINDLTPEQTEQ